VYPIAATGYEGFSLLVDASNTFSRSPEVSGKVYAASYVFPTPENLEIAIGHMMVAYTDVRARPQSNYSRVNLGADAGIGGMVLTPGVYTWQTNVNIGTNITLAGGPCAVFILQTAMSVIVAADAAVILSGGVQASNVFWQVHGLVEVGSRAQMKVRPPFLLFFLLLIFF
jgi:hypothetical protein